MIRRSTWILLLVFVLLIIGTVYIQRRESNTEANATPTIEADTPFLVIPEGVDIVGVRIMNESGDVVDISRQNASNEWSVANQDDGIVDNDRITTALSRLQSVNIKAELEDDTPLEVLGLASPDYTITLRLSADNQLKVYVGSVTIASDSYYSLVDNGSALVVSKSGLDAVIGFLEDPPILVPASTPISEPQP